jgi:hypothetical protein
VAILRILIVSLLAAVSACAAASLILFGFIERASFAPMIFTLMGSVFLLAPGYAAAREAGLPRPIRYALLLLIGAVAGALMLGVISLVTDPLQGALMGAFYGSTTAVCWIVLHFGGKKLAFSRS